MIDAVKARIETIPELSGRVRGGGDFASLQTRKERPSAPVFAHVLYAGLLPEAAPDAVTGLYRQAIREGVNIVLTLRAGDRDGEDAIDRVQELQASILELMCGWAPGNEIGVFELARSAMVSFSKGTVNWQIDLTISDQLRIST